MFKEDTQNELIGYISRMGEGERKRLLESLKKQEVYKKVVEADKKQRAFNKGKKKMTDDEVVAIVRQIRRKNARKRA